jgi:ABC-type multidrug transport system fused ATPase/permease subunit
VALMLRFYDLTSSTIAIDGQNIAEVTQESPQHKFVPQDPILFRMRHNSLRSARRW